MGFVTEGCRFLNLTGFGSATNQVGLKLRIVRLQIYVIPQSLLGAKGAGTVPNLFPFFPFLKCIIIVWNSFVFRCISSICSRAHLIKYYSACNLFWMTVSSTNSIVIAYYFLWWNSIDNDNDLPCSFNVNF